jgi:hypothetical protein
MRGDKRRLAVTIGAGARPPGGFVLAWPFDGAPPPARIDGRPARWRNGALTFAATGRPIRIDIAQ